MTQPLEEALSLILYVLIIVELILLQFKRIKRNRAKRYSCHIVDGKIRDKKYF